MKFLIDAQLPRRITEWLHAAGFDAVHTLDLPEANRTSDSAIIRLAIKEQRVVVTKDADFVSSFVLSHRPEKLLLISTGNITNVDLEMLLVPNIAAIASAFQYNDFVELTRTALIIHP